MVNFFFYIITLYNYYKVMTFGFRKKNSGAMPIALSYFYKIVCVYMHMFFYVLIVD